MSTKTRRLSKAARKAVKSIRKASRTLDPVLVRLIRSESRRVREFDRTITN